MKEHAKAFTQLLPFLFLYVDAKFNNIWKIKKSNKQLVPN